MTVQADAGFGARLRRWLLSEQAQQPEGFHEPGPQAQAQHHQHPWWKVMCLTGVDYFSSLGYQPGIAALAAGALSPIATLVLVMVTLFGALPMYRRVAKESPHGDGSISMLERLLSYWPSKVLVLALIGFVATGFVITITLSAADASAHLIENPFLTGALHGKQVVITLALIALLGVVFLKGFNEAIGIAVGLVIVYIGLSAAVMIKGVTLVVAQPELIAGWLGALRQGFPSTLAVIGGALLVFPRLALGLSGFETGVVVMPLIQGDPGDSEANPRGRIRNGRKLLTTAALIMSVLLIGSAFVTTVLIPPSGFWPDTTATRNVTTSDLASGQAVVAVPLDDPNSPQHTYSLHLPANARGSFTVQARTLGGTVPVNVTVGQPGDRVVPVTVEKPAGGANGRALAYLAHKQLGEAFGTVYDISTIFILWFAGASAMAGLLNIVPRYLPRYGMAPDWTRVNRPLVLIFTGVCFLVTLAFGASVDEQSGAYATGVLALMTSAAIAVTLSCFRNGERVLGGYFAVISLIFVYTSVVTVGQRPEGLYIALLFIAAILAVSIWSRVSRATELRTERVELDHTATYLIVDAARRGELRFIANHLDAGDSDEYRLKELDVRLDTHLPARDPVLFLEVTVADASEFRDVLEVRGYEVDGYRIVRAESSAVPNAIAAFLLHVRDVTGIVPHVYFEWDEEAPVKNALRFLLAGEGDIPPLTHEVLRQAEPDRLRRPVVHVGG